MLAPDEVRQIVDAIEQLDWVQFVKSQMQTGAAPGAEALGGGQPGGPAPPPDLGGGAPPANGEASASPPPPPGGNGGGPPPARGPEDPEKLGASRYAADSEQDLFEPEDDTKDYAAGLKPAGVRVTKRKAYAGEGSVSGMDAGQTPGQGSAGGMADAGAQSEAYRAGGVPRAQYSRLQSEMAQIQRQLQEMHGRFEQERATRVDSERYAALREKAVYYTFDIEKEVERCRYSKMNDAQFDEHLELIDANYRPNNVGVDLFVPNTVPRSPASAPGPRGRERYSREISDRARAIAELRALRGEEVDYETVLEDVARGGPAAATA